MQLQDRVFLMTGAKGGLGAFVSEAFLAAGAHVLGVSRSISSSDFSHERFHALSPFGIRALSRAHLENPYAFHADGREYRVDYEPGESSTNLFGGNSNWRGPIWFPVNYLLIESLQKYHHYLGDGFRVEFPTGSGNYLSLAEVARELSHRLARLFLRDGSGDRPVHGGNPIYRDDPAWNRLVLFHEYFHGDTGEGLGASHQTGWTGLVAKLLHQSGE